MPATTIGSATRRSDVPAARIAVSSLNRLRRISVNAAPTTAIMPLRWTKISGIWYA